MRTLPKMAFFIVWIASYRSTYSIRSKLCSPSSASHFIVTITLDCDGSSWSTHNHHFLLFAFFSYAHNFVYVEVVTLSRKEVYFRQESLFSIVWSEYESVFYGWIWSGWQLF